jgi:hypothetical protein
MSNIVKRTCNSCLNEKSHTSFYRGMDCCMKCHNAKDIKVPVIKTENFITSFLLVEPSSDGKDGFATGEDYYITYEKGLLIVKYLKKKKSDGSSYIKWFSVHNTREIIV